MEKTNLLLTKFTSLAFISCETKVQLLQTQDKRKVGFQHQITKTQKPSPVGGHGILTERMVQLLLHERGCI